MSTDQKIEATLFFGFAPRDAFRKLPDTLVMALAGTGVETRPLLNSGTDIVLAVGEVTMTIALAERGLDPATLHHCNRPECATTPMEEAQLRLALHGAAVVIRVTGPKHAAKTETRLALAYIATMQLLKLAQPDLVHWAKSDTLYTIEEFRSSTGAHRPIRPRPAKTLPRRAARPVQRQPIPAEWKGRSFVPGVAASALSPAAPTQCPEPALTAASPHRASRLRSAMTRGALAGMSAPLSLSYLMQFLLPDARLG